MRNRVREQRGQRGLSQAEVAAAPGLGYLFGLSNYGVGAQDPADDEADAEYGAPFPVS
jgi:hypothetical protein